MFAIVDVETTGGYSDQHRVIEVGIAISDGSKILERYNQLVNPERPIPSHITQLTGISNKDVEDAPTFGEIASEVFDLIQGQIFIAHNVNFDYTFIRKELEAAGYTWQAKKGCTVRLSRKVYPGLKSYSLGSLAEHFNIVNPNPHRALADAETAAEILHILIEKDRGEVELQLHQRSSVTQLPIHLDAKVFHALPEEPGVYYMLGEKGEYLYIGKAINIKQRIAQHFTGSSGSKRRQRWLREVFDIKYVLTGSEALALLHEDYEIRHYWPPYNSAQKHPVAKWGIVHYRDRKSQIRFAVQRAEKRVDVLEHFYSYTAAQQYLAECVREFNLSPELSGLGWQGEISPEVHQDNAQQWLETIKKEKNTGLLIYPGVNPDEQGFVFISEGRYGGMGMKPKGSPVEELDQWLWHRHESPTAEQILRALIRDESVDFQPI